MNGARDVAAPTELFTLPALAIARLVRERKVSPVDVLEAHLDRIEALDPTMKAFQVVRRDEALAEAAVLADRQDLDALPLAAVPVGVKDNVDVAGTPTRQGSAGTSSAPAERDDELVSRLRSAGCVVIGKTQMPELAIWPFTEPTAFPVTRNPWDLDRTPGGSTGGGAAAVAAGMTALALGSDGGGSLRVPAACCGIVGLKPGAGVVPLAGGAAVHWYGMTAFGPLARTVSDTAIALMCSPAGRRIESPARRSGRFESRSPRATRRSVLEPRAKSRRRSWKSPVSYETLDTPSARPGLHTQRAWACASASMAGRNR